MDYRTKELIAWAHEHLKEDFITVLEAIECGDMEDARRMFHVISEVVTTLSIIGDRSNGLQK